MCSHYQTLKDAELPLKKFGAPDKPAGGKYDLWPGNGNRQPKHKPLGISRILGNRKL